ncbi:MAG TPA: beta-ketoacyl synthase N-terminal-like domain-containing protein, partial [Rhodocyclaceae bacterium]|nr:beta-ketoacyl synthase N-terminal-like domain-containing protein [Rhodocyclaceae bacterium]
MTLRRVVITGFGIVSCIGNDAETVTQALRDGRSGISHVPEYAELGLTSQVAGIPDLSGEPTIDRKTRRFMADASIYAHHAMRKAVDQARLSSAEIAHPRTGLIVGSGVGSPFQHQQAVDTMRTRGLPKVAPYYVPRVMGSTTSACLAMAWGILGPSYSITSACATSAHCIGNAADQIRFGLLDRAFAGGAEEVHWTTTMPFDAMGALSRKFNHAPAIASRPFDQDRDGFVIAGGAGILVLEAEEIARSRGATIYGELA